MKPLTKETQILRSRFLHVTRSFLMKSEFIEVDTPIFKPIVGMEPYLDPYLVTSPDRKEKGYLITSPEYSLKQLLASGLDKIFEITHTFRASEEGSPYHSREFLMLELYARDWNDIEMMQFIRKYFEALFQSFFNLPSVQKLDQNFLFKTISVEDIFRQVTGKGFEQINLIEMIREEKLSTTSEDKLEDWAYEDLFFLVFLNLIEPKLGEGIVFLYDYPPECAALAKIVTGKAKRFEIYWDGVELANAFWELTDCEEQRKRFIKEQMIRSRLGKEVFSIDEDFMAVFDDKSFPDSCGISLGLDRIFMKILGRNHLEGTSPYYHKNERIALQD